MNRKLSLIEYETVKGISHYPGAVLMRARSLRGLSQELRLTKTIENPYKDAHNT